MYARKFVGRFADDDFVQSCLSGLGQCVHEDEVLLMRRGHIPFDKFTVIDRFDRDIGPLPERRVHDAVVNMRLAASAQAAEKREAEERAARFTSALQPVEPVAGAPSGSQPPAAGAPSGGAQPAAGVPSGGSQPAAGAPSGSPQPAPQPVPAAPSGSQPVAGAPSGSPQPAAGAPPGPQQPAAGARDAQRRADLERIYQEQQRQRQQQEERREGVQRRTLQEFLREHGYRDCIEFRNGKNALHVAVAQAKQDATMEAGLLIA